MFAYFARKALAYVVPVALQYVANFAAGAACPVALGAVVCTGVWPSAIAAVLGVLAFYGIHPNGAHGGPAPTAITKAMAAIKLAPPVPAVEQLEEEDPELARLRDPSRG